MLFHADEAEAAKALPTIMAWPALGMTMMVTTYDDPCNPSQTNPVFTALH